MAVKFFDSVNRIKQDYEVGLDDEYIGASTRTGPITVLLPSIGSIDTKHGFVIKDEARQAKTYPIRIQAQAGEEINGSSIYEMNVDYGTIEVFHNGVQWVVLGSNGPSVLSIEAGGTGADNAEEAVDNLGLDIKAPVRVASKTNVNIAAFPSAVNSVTLAAGDSVLLWLQTDPTENGVYEVIDAGTGTDGVWERRADFDASSEIRAGTRFLTLEGGSFANIYFIVISNNPVVGTDPILFQPLNDATAVYDPYGNIVFGYSYNVDAENYFRAESGGAGVSPTLRAFSDVNSNVSGIIATKGNGKIYQLSTIEILDQIPLDTASDVTYSANAVLGGFLSRDPNGAARVDTIPSATTILGLMPQHFDNLSFRLKIYNAGTTGETITLAASTGITLVGDCVIQPETTREFFFHITDTAILGGTDTIVVYDLYPASTSGYGAGQGLVVNGSNLDLDRTGDFAWHINPANINSTDTAYSGAEFVGGLILRDPNGGNRVDTTPNAAQIVTAIPNAFVGISFRLFVYNATDAMETLTINAGSGVTLVGTAFIQPRKVQEYICVIDNVGAGTEAVTMLVIDGTQLSSGQVAASNIGATFRAVYHTDHPVSKVDRLYITSPVGADMTFGATLLQATSGATAVISGLNLNGSIDIDTIVGAFDATNVVTGTNADLSTFTFTPTELLINGWAPLLTPSAVTSVVANDGTILAMNGGLPLTAGKVRYTSTINSSPFGNFETLSSDGWTGLYLDYAGTTITIS